MSSFADTIASDSSDDEKAPEMVTEMQDSVMNNVPPHLTSRVSDANVTPVLNSTVNVESEQVLPIQANLSMKDVLIEKGVPEEVAAMITPDIFEIIGKTRKNQLVHKWATRKKGEAILKEQAHVSPTELVIPKVVKNTMTVYEDQVKAQGKQIVELQKGMSKILKFLSADQDAPFVAAPIASASPQSVPKVAPKSAVTVTATGEKIAPDVFYRFAITQLRAKNQPYGKDGKVSKGVHAVYSGLNNEVKKYYGADTDVVALTNLLESQGKVVTRMVRGGPMVYLPEDFKTEGVQAGSSIIIR